MLRLGSRGNMRLKQAYDFDLCSEGSPLLAKGSADLNTNKEMPCMAKKVKQSYTVARDGR